MKKVLVLLAMVLGASSMYGFEVDGILYNITSETNQTVEVTHKDFNGNYQGEIIIPESIRYNGKTYTVTAIGDNAFYNCYYMTSITIPKTIVSVGKYAFVDCIRIASVTLYCKTVGRWFSEISSIKNVVLGNGVESIEENAFLRCGITSLSIANTVNSIGKYAFSQCSISALVIPSGVKTIGVYAFAGCNSLKNVEISNGVRTIANYAFFGCRKLRSVTIPPSVSSIGLGAFKECYDLRNVKMPESISKDKYSHSFEDETLLYITLYRPDNVESVEADINDAARGNVDDPITEEQSKKTVLENEASPNLDDTALQVMALSWQLREKLEKGDIEAAKPIAESLYNKLKSSNSNKEKNLETEMVGYIHLASFYESTKDNANIQSCIQKAINIAQKILKINPNNSTAKSVINDLNN